MCFPPLLSCKKTREFCGGARSLSFCDCFLIANLTYSVERKRPAVRLMMKEASIPSSPAISSCSGETRHVGEHMPRPAALVSLYDYEEGFYHAVRDVYGPGGIIDAPTGVTAIFEAMKLHVEQVFVAGESLQQSAAAGCESSKLFLNEQVKAQELSHYRSKEDVAAFYLKALNQCRGYEHVFVQASLALERSRVFNDQLNRLLLDSASRQAHPRHQELLLLSRRSSCMNT